MPFGSLSDGDLDVVDSSEMLREAKSENIAESTSAHESTPLHRVINPVVVGRIFSVILSTSEVTSLGFAYILGLRLQQKKTEF